MLLILIVLLVVGAWAALMFISSKDSKKQTVPVNEKNISKDVNEIEKKQNLIKVDSLKEGDIVKSPLVITGQARGHWFFEASFPVKVIDADGKQLGVAAAQAKSDWMTENFVPFEAMVEFSAPTTNSGFVVLEKDNPSGLSQNADELRIPVNFEIRGEQRPVKLYYYNPAKDKDESGNVMCSKQGLVEVERQMLVTKTPIQDVIKLLIQGQLKDQEKVEGIETEFPLEGVELKGASLKDGVLTLEFLDPNNKTSGGSCRAGILWNQIEATAKQFSEVQSVKFIPEDIFQP